MGSEQSNKSISPDQPALVMRLINAFRASWVDEHSISEWAAPHAASVVLLAGESRRFPEGQDVAVILPELQKAFPGRFEIAVVPREREDRVAAMYGVVRWPSLVILKKGQYVTTLTGMLDWDVYLVEMARALKMPVSRAPTVGIPIVSKPPTQPASHD